MSVLLAAVRRVGLRCKWEELRGEMDGVLN
jgi:hypothetical protein